MRTCLGLPVAQKGSDTGIRLSKKRPPARRPESQEIRADRAARRLGLTSKTSESLSKRRI
jgi:hypothetical protein